MFRRYRHPVRLSVGALHANTTQFDMTKFGSGKNRCWWNKERIGKETISNQQHSIRRVRKRLYPFLFFLLGAQCVESGVSCTDCY